MTRKTKLILAAILLVVVVGGPAAYLGGRYALNRRVAAWRQEGIAASTAGDHVRASELLVRYLQRNPWDEEALSRYITSRERAELPNAQHLAETIGALKLLLAEAPHRLADWHHLLALYVKLERRPEALDVANAILAKHPKDVPTLATKTDVLTKMRRDREALDVATAWRDVAPAGDLKAQMAVVAVRARLNHPADSIVAEVRKLHDAHPGDPRFELLLGYAYGQTGDDAQATQWLKAAARHPQVDDEFVTTVVAQFDSLGLGQDALGILRDHVSRGGGPALRHALGRRLWEMGKWAEAAQVLGPIDPAEASADVTLVAMKAMSLANAGKADEAAGCRAALGARPQASARAWTLVLRRALDAVQTDDKELAGVCREALMADPENAYLDYYLGDANARLGELDQSVEAWQRVTARNLSWNVPAVRLVEALLLKGKPEQAMWVASAAARRNPNDAAAVITLARAWAVGVESGSVAHADELFNVVSQIQRVLPGEDQTLLIHIQLLGQRGKKDEAVQAARTVLARNPAAPEGMLLALVTLSRRFSLGLEAECFTRSAAAHGETPALVYAQAIDQLVSGRPDAGVALLDKAAERNAKDSRPAWPLARARYLDVLGREDARQTWVALGDQFPNDLAVQQSAAAARAVQGDWEFMERTIGRLRALTGDRGLEWRLAKARLMVDASREPSDVEQGSLLLNEIIREYPQVSEAHVLLARALVQMKRLDAAVERLSFAARLEPTSVPIALQLAALLQSRGDFGRVRQELDRVAPRLRTGVERRKAALMLASQGSRQEALQLLEADQSAAASENPGQSGGEDLLLAALYREQNQFAKAEEVVRKLLAKPEPDLATLQFAASLHLSRGRRAEAENVLRRLDGMKLETGVRELAWGAFLAEVGDLPAAAQRYEAATREAPANPTAWRALIRAQTQQGQADAAVATIDRATRAVPADAPLAALKAHAPVLREAAADPDLRPIALYFINDPDGAKPATELLGTLLEARRSNDVERLTGRLQQFVERHRHILPGHIELIRAYWAMGRTGEAITAAQHAMALFPADPNPAKTAVGLYAAAGRHKDMLDAAQAWRKRSAGDALQADVAITQAHLRLGQYEAAAAQLVPYLAAAAGGEDRYADALTVYGIALANSGRSAAASELLWPLATKDGKWRIRWMIVALDMRDGAVAVNWLDRVAATIPASGVDERMVLAEAYEQLGRPERLNDPKLMSKAADLFDQLIAHPGASAEVLTAAAVRAERLGDLALAEKLYRRALALNPSMYVAQNNLALVIAGNGGNPAEAANAAAAAVQLQPRQATVRDTLAQVQARVGNFQGAVDNMRAAVTLEPDNAKWRVRLAQYLLDKGDVVEAARAVSAIDERRLEVRGLPPAIQQQLDAVRKQIRPSGGTKAG